MSSLSTTQSGVLLSQVLRSRNDRISLAFAGAVALISIALCAYAYLDCITYGPPIRADGYGYYAYLTSVFIDGDLSMRSAKAFRWTVVGNHPLPYEWDGISIFPGTGRFLDKYTIGVALLQSPFFLIAHVFAKLTGAPAYSIPYQIANTISGIFYFVLGVYFLLRYLLKKLDVSVSLITITAIIFCTNTIHYGTYQATVSHVYSFFLFSLLINITYVYETAKDNEKKKILINDCLFGVVVGLIALTRVPNIIAGIVPASLVLRRFARKRDLRLLVEEFSCGALALLITFSPQSFYWHAVTGHFFLNSYQGETFDWLHPKIIPFLFSMRRGLFFWSPVTLVALAGLPLLIRKDRWLGTAIALVFALEVYICSSWWSWWFGSSYGARPVVDIMPLLAVPLAYSFAWLGARLGRALPVAIVSVLAAINLFLMLSLWHAYIPWDNLSVSDLEALPFKWEPQELLTSLHRRFLPPYAPGTAFQADRLPPMSMLMLGWDDRPAPAIWSVGKETTLYIRPELPKTGDLCLDVTFASPGALLTVRHPVQRAIVDVDGVTIGTIRLTLNGSSGRRMLDIPRQMLRDGRVARIDFELPDATSPERLGINHDPRLLALYISRMSVDPQPATSHRCGI